MGRLISVLRSLACATRRGFHRFSEDILSNSELTEAKYKQWDIRLKMVGGVGVLVAAWWAVHSYNETAEREARKEFWGRQIALYFEATEATSEIATLPSGDPNRQKAIDRFWSLYFGQLRVVEDDKNVGIAMVRFGMCLTQPGDSGPVDPSCANDSAQLQQRALDLAVRCRLSVAENWDRKLNGLHQL